MVDSSELAETGGAGESIKSLAVSGEGMKKSELVVSEGIFSSKCMWRLHVLHTLTHINQVHVG